MRDRQIAVATHGRVNALMSDMAVLASYALVVAWLFHKHLLGDYTFPWDFQGGYHAHAVARLRDGSFLSPPLWMPWGGFGIPSQLSLQDGAWYLPLYAFHALFGYDMVDATRLQVLHVLAGGFGMYLLCRSLGIGRAAALMAGLAYLLGGTFYSNAQHVDIVRGAGLLPWLMLALNALWQKQTAARFGLFVIVLWQFLAAAYPGQVVAAAYFCAVTMMLFVAHAAWMRRPWKARATLVATAAACGAGLILLKFLPSVLDPDSVRQSAVPEALADRRVLTTLLLDVDLSFMPNDISMRDLFFPAALLPFVVLGLQRSRASLLGMLGLVLAALFMADVTSLQAIAGSLPLTRISRFPIADFRPILHLSLALLAAVGLERVRGDELRDSRAAARIAIVSIGAALLIAFGLRMGHPVKAGAFAAAALGVGIVVCGWLRITRGSPHRMRAALVVLAAAVTVHGAMHQLSVGRAWRSEWSLAHEYAIYGTALRNLTSANRFEALEHRPARIVYERLPVGNLVDLFSPKYQHGWYAEGFSAFGYENVKASPRIRQLYSLALSDASPSQRSVLAWLLRRSAVYVAPDTQEVSPAALQACDQPVCATEGARAAVVEMEAFREQGAVYRVQAAQGIRIVENEVYYPGWSSLLCEGATCRPGPDALAEHSLLRVWRLPPGNYRLVTYFMPPAWRLSVAIAWISAFLALLMVGMLAAAAARRRRAPLPQSI